jgi:hypothetical protein
MSVYLVETKGKEQAWVRVSDPKFMNPTPEEIIHEISLTAFSTPRNKSERAAKQRCLAMLCRIKGLYIERHEVTGKDGGPIELARVDELEIARRVAFVLERGRRMIRGEKVNTGPPKCISQQH